MAESLLTEFAEQLRRMTEQLCRDKLPALIGELEAAKAHAWVRLLTANDKTASPVFEDQLLDVKQAAARLGISSDTLYRRAREGRCPFAVRVGPGSLRFSSKGLERFISQRSGR